MIIIPERELVLITAPRTASGSLRRAIKVRYPEAITLYHHMEADGVPAGYDRWRRLGVVRHPLDRLWSLYKFSRATAAAKHQHYLDALHGSVELPFDDWIVNNTHVFTAPYDSFGTLKFWPMYTVKHSLPETRKSQFLYLRPDLGTEIVLFDRMHELADHIDLNMPRHNRTDDEPAPPIAPETLDHMQRFFEWDYTTVNVLRDGATA